MLSQRSTAGVKAEETYARTGGFRQTVGKVVLHEYRAAV